MRLISGRTLAPLTGALVILALPLGAQGAGGARQQAVGQALQRRGAVLEAAHAKGDAKAFASVFTTDAVLTFNDTTVVGRAAIEQFEAAEFAQLAGGVPLRSMPQPPIVTGPATAISYGTLQEPNQGGSVSGRFLAVWVRRGGIWQMRAAQVIVPAQMSTAGAPGEMPAQMPMPTDSMPTDSTRTDSIPTDSTRS